MSTVRMTPSTREQAIAAFRAGATAHQAGAAVEAEAAYREALRLQPDLADCIGLLGVLLHQTGRSEEAVKLLRRAASLQPTGAEHQSNLGSVLREMGRSSDAVVSFRKAAKLQPGNPQIQRNLGAALADLGQFGEAADCFDAALRLDPFYADAANDLGNALVALNRPEEALGPFQAAINLQPANAAFRNNLGIALRNLDRIDEAIICFRAAVALKPDYANGWSNLGNALQEREEAAEALDCLQRAQKLAPESSHCAANLGASLYRQRRLVEARQVFERALERDPGSVVLRWNHSHVALAQGDYQAGWAGFEARWQMPDLSRGWHKSAAATWKPGQRLDGKTILLFAEQGFGDTLQFVRFAPALAQQGARVLLLVQPELVSLLARVPGLAGCFGFGDRLPRYDLQYPLMSLPFALGITLEGLQQPGVYLPNQPDAMGQWKERLNPYPGTKVGLVWAGDPRPDQPETSRVDRRRSMRLEQLRPLLDSEGVTFVSLQKGRVADELRHAVPVLPVIDWTDELGSFADTAALVEALDLVITVDTAVAHLAGGLGRPVWLLNRFDSCWRWLDGRDDSPWYPTLRQFRQQSPGDWGEVVQRVRQALLSLA